MHVNYCEVLFDQQVLLSFRDKAQGSYVRILVLLLLREPG